MITLGRKLQHLRLKNHLTQQELGLALGYTESSAGPRIAQYESGVRSPKEQTCKELAKLLGVPLEILTVPVLSEPKEYDATSYWMHELASEL